MAASNNHGAEVPAAGVSNGSSNGGAAQEVNGNHAAKAERTTQFAPLKKRSLSSTRSEMGASSSSNDLKSMSSSSPSSSSSSSNGAANGSTSSSDPSRRPGPFSRLRGGLRVRRSRSAPAGGRRPRLVEQHFRVDSTTSGKVVVLPGVPKHDPDWARDCHDYFNLILLVPVVVLNLMNWNWDSVLSFKTHCWTGQWFWEFFSITAFYFVVDLTWVAVVPSCVKSPATIIQHHIATLLYILIPTQLPQYRWLMGACMLVEINTWFLIARRVFNKQGFPPWIIDLPPFVSIKIKLISIFFYISWIGIRCLLYPYLLKVLLEVWVEHSQHVGTYANLVAITLPLHSIFCALNLKWSYDLLMSKVRYWRKGGKGKYVVDKGL